MLQMKEWITLFISHRTTGYSHKLGMCCSRHVGHK